VSAGKDLKISLFGVRVADDGSHNVLHHEMSFEGHTGDILCVSWSPKSTSFLSASMDKTARMWNLPTEQHQQQQQHRQNLQHSDRNSQRREDCTRAVALFEHSDFVTSIAFHPNNEWFVSGSFDKKLRVWSIREKSVLFWVDIATYITSIALASQGRMVICGDHEGKATFFDTEGLRWVTQIHVRSRRGRNSKGKKISGIRVMPDQESILITSNDSRIRLFRLSDFGLICKYKGVVNDSFQLVASPSETGEHIICGSEATTVHIWNTNKRNEGLSFSLARQKFTERKDRNRSYEFWKCSEAAVTVAIFATAAMREQLLLPGGPDRPPEDPVEASVSLVLIADETGKIVVYENRRRMRKHAAMYRTVLSRDRSSVRGSMDRGEMTNSSRFQHKPLASSVNIRVSPRGGSTAGATTTTTQPVPPPKLVVSNSDMVPVLDRSSDAGVVLDRSSDRAALQGGKRISVTMAKVVEDDSSDSL
jgi:WD40 repeat protein